MRLIKGNIERIVEDRVKADRINADGFKELEATEEVKAEAITGSETPIKPEKKLLIFNLLW